MRHSKVRGLNILLVLVACAALAMIAAACTSRGGGGSVTPCCDATGQTETPPPALTSEGNAASNGYFAEPFIFPNDATDCLTLDASSNPILPTSRKSVGKKVAVDATGRYTVAINAAALGFPVYVAITDASGSVKGVAVTSTESAATSDSYHLAPIRFLSGIGETTLEAALWCSLNVTGQVGDLHVFDVKAFVTSGMAATFTGDLAGMATNATKFSDAVGDFTRLPTALGGNTAGTVTEQAMIALREKAESDVDSCLDGTNPDTATIDCTTNDSFRATRAELYRGWRMVNVGTSDGITAMGPFTIEELSITLAQTYGFGMSGTTVASEMDRRGQILRVEAARATIQSNATTLGLGATSIATALQKLDLLREAAVEYTDPIAFSTTAQTVANSVLTTLQQDANANLLGGGCDPTAIMNGSGVPTYDAFIQNAPANIAAIGILRGVFDPIAPASPTLVSQIDTQLQQSCTNPLADLVHWRNMTVAMSIIASPYPK